MPDGTKVGEVFVEGRLEYDASNTPAFMSAMQRDLRRRLPDISNDLKSFVGSGISDGLSDGADKGMDRARTNIDRKLRSLNLKTPDLDVPVGRALGNIDEVQNKLKTIRDSDNSAKIRIDAAGADKDLESLKQRIVSQLDAGGDAGSAKAVDRLNTRLRGLDVKTPDLDVPVSKALLDLDRVKAELDAIGAKEVSPEIKLDIDRALTDLALLKARIAAQPLEQKVHLEVETDPLENGIRTSIGRALASAFKPSPEITESLFEMVRTGLSRSILQVFSSPAMLAAGAALVAVLGQALVAGTVFLGAALTGAIVGGLGLAAIAAGIALVANDPQILQAGQKIADKMGEGLTKAAEAFKTPVKNALETLSGTVDAIMPHISRIFTDLAPHVENLARAIDGMIRNLFPGLENLLTHLEPVIGAIERGLVKIGAATGDFFNKLADPKVVQGAALALEDTFNILSGLIRLAGDFLAAMSKAWTEIRPKLVEMSAALNEIGINGKLVGDIMTLLGAILLTNLVGGIIMVTNTAKALGAVWDGLRAAWSATTEWITGTFVPAVKSAWEDFRNSLNQAGRDFENLGNNIKNIWNNITGFFASAIQAVKDGWRGFRDSLDQAGRDFENLGNNIKGVWDKITEIFTTGIQSIRDSWKTFRDDINNVSAISFEGLRAAWQDFRTDVDGVIAEVKSAWKDFRDDVGNIGVFQSALDGIRSAWRDFRGDVNSIIDEVRSSWKAFRDDIGNASSISFEELKGAWRSFRDDVNGAINSVKDAWRDFQDDLGSRITQIKGFFEDLRGSFTPVADALKAAGSEIKAAWNDLSADLGNRVTQIKGFFEDLKGAWNSLKDLGGGVLSEIKSAWASLADDIGNRVNQLKGFFEDLKQVWSSLKDSANDALSGIKDAWRDLRDDIQGRVEDLKGVWRQISDAWNDAINDVRGALDGVKGTWNDFRSELDGAVDGVKNIWNDIRDAWSDAVNDVKGLLDEVKQAWDSLFESLTGAGSDAVNQIKDLFSSIGEGVDLGGVFDGVRDAWNALTDDIGSGIDRVKGFFNDLLSSATGSLDGLKGAWTSVKDHITAAFNAARDAVSAAATGIATTIFGTIKSGLDSLKAAFTSLKDQITSTWDGIKSTISRIWNEIRTQVFDAMGVFASVTLPAKFTDFKNKVIRTFSEVRDTIGRIWNEMLNAAKSAVNTLGGFINRVIDAVNKIPFIKDKLPKLPGFEAGGAVKKAVGGAVSGGEPGTDTVPAISNWGQRYLLDNGEHILTKRDVHAMGGQRNVYKFRRGLHQYGFKHGYRVDGPETPGKVWTRASGGAVFNGRVGAQNNQLLNEHKNHVHVAMNVPRMGYPLIIAKAVTSGIPHSVGSTYRPGSRAAGGGLDHHSEGRAVDFPGFEQDKFAGWWEKQSGVIELIHRTKLRDYAIFGGGGGGISSFFSTAAGKIIKAAIDAAMKVFRDGIDKVFPGHKETVAPAIGHGLFSNIGDQLTSFYEDAGGGAPGSPEQVKKWIAEAGKHVNIEWVDGLITLIMRESGGNPRAQNNSDLNAQRGTPSKGLMQTIDPTFNRYRDPKLPNDPFDPIANIVAGMNYVHARYGSLRNVQQAHSERPPMGYEDGGSIRKVFDDGGALRPGLNLIDNLTGKPETILNPQQSSFVGRVLTGENFHLEARIFVGDKEIKDIVETQIHARDTDLVAGLQSGRRI